MAAAYMAWIWCPDCEMMGDTQGCEAHWLEDAAYTGRRVFDEPGAAVEAGWEWIGDTIMECAVYEFKSREAALAVPNKPGERNVTSEARHIAEERG